MAKPQMYLTITLSFFLLLSNFQQLRAENVCRAENYVCQLQSLTAMEPEHRLQAEAGVTEYWDWKKPCFQCAGVFAFRDVIQPRGLVLPRYTNAPSLLYVVQGRGTSGVMMSGCPETFESSQQFSKERERGQERERFQDEHQQIRRFQEGDIIALPAGVSHWCYNDGEEDLVLVVMEHTSNYQNQLDNNPRSFFLAGNPQAKQEQEQQKHHQQQHHLGNVFDGLKAETLAEIFGVDQETARKLQGKDDQRGHIVKVEGELQFIRPPMSIEQEQKQQKGEKANGIEETICSARLVQNINDPSRTDFFNPRAGRITSLNRFNLPILNYIQLSAERGVLYKNAIKSPNWKQNAHTIVYATRGECQMQIVDQRGKAVFNDRIREGQIVIIPQNFVVSSQASDKGFEWISFKTNENAIFNDLAGRTSVLRAMPVDVLANAYQIPREKARSLKFNREESVIFESSQKGVAQLREYVNVFA